MIFSISQVFGRGKKPLIRWRDHWILKPQKIWDNSRNLQYRVKGVIYNILGLP
jgi:hypothetical protein